MDVDHGIDGAEGVGAETVTAGVAIVAVGVIIGTGDGDVGGVGRTAVSSESRTEPMLLEATTTASRMAARNIETATVRRCMRFFTE
jgi:hypothetical protein